MQIINALDSHHRSSWESKNNRKLSEWWPVSGKFKPARFEIVVGTILTQNTNWKNVERALSGLARNKLTSAEAIAGCRTARLQKTIRPAGFFVQKAQRLKTLCKFILSFNGKFYSKVSREQLLALKGIGPETADSILLFACNRPEFVVDAYTKRIFSRYGVFKDDSGYESMKSFFEECFPKDAARYKEIHALIVEHAKGICKSRPECGKCPLQNCIKAGVP